MKTTNYPPKRFIVIALFLLCLLASGCAIHPSTAAASPTSPQPRRVIITGYDGDSMEPFISRDGRYLLFNNLNQPQVNTDIHFAERKNDFEWIYRGKVKGINTPALEGCATMDRNGRLFFVSPRSYPKTLCTIYQGQFQDGVVSDVQVVESISLKQPGIVNFDVDVSPDGKMLVFVDSRFLPGVGPLSANLVLADWDGARFVRSPASARLLALVNQARLVYAPTLSSDKLTLYFTQYDPQSNATGPQIYRATRSALTAPFGPPVHLEGLGDYVEGSALSPDETLLYFHRKDGQQFHLYAVATH